MIKGHLETEFWGKIYTPRLLQFFNDVPSHATVKIEKNQSSTDEESWIKITADWLE